VAGRSTAAGLIGWGAVLFGAMRAAGAALFTVYLFREVVVCPASLTAAAVSSSFQWISVYSIRFTQP
jgi:hypothetical protein